MGLDAMVFCDCVEKNRLKVPHPFPRLLYVSSNGSPEIRSDDPVQVEKHDKWIESPPCKHDAMMVHGCFLGNVIAIDRVRDALTAVLRGSQLACPILLRKVLYCGTHTGDHLTVAQVQRLAIELQKLGSLDFKQVGVSPGDKRLIISVITKLDKLTRIACKIKKPIAF